MAQVFSRKLKCVFRLNSNNFHFPDGTSHQGSITCIDAHRDNVLVATGSEDSTVKVVNTSSGKVRIWNIFMLLI